MLIQYTVSGIHGCYDKYIKLLRHIIVPFLGNHEYAALTCLLWLMEELTEENTEADKLLWWLKRNGKTGMKSAPTGSRPGGGADMGVRGVEAAENVRYLPSRTAIKVALFSCGVVVGRPRSARAPRAHFTSMNVN